MLNARIVVSNIILSIYRSYQLPRSLLRVKLDDKLLLS